jgi:hypothetical protein
MASWWGVYVVLAASAIYRCPGTDDAPLFTDRPCPVGEAVQLDPLGVLEWPALDAADWARVRQLDAERVRDARARAAQRAQHARAAAAAASSRERQCRAARDGLERVRAIKRRGYAATSTADLAARQRKYSAQFDRHCR